MNADESVRIHREVATTSTRSIQSRELFGKAICVHLRALICVHLR
jgi:hypothetical protein